MKGFMLHFLKFYKIIFIITNLISKYAIIMKTINPIYITKDDMIIIIFLCVGVYVIGRYF